MKQPDTMRDFLVLSRGQWDEKATPEQVQVAIDQFYVWYESALAEGRMKPGSRLSKEARLVSKAAVVDGPFTEAKEIVGGFWFIVASTLEEATQIVAENPCLAYGLAMELRPLDARPAKAGETTNETPPTWLTG